MESLSRNKLRQEVRSMRPSIARGRVHLCRKIIADIKKLSKKKVNDQLKNEKNTRKIQRLTDEVHELKQLKPNSIAEFALSHTVESAEALRENPDISSRNRLLAKLSLHKLIKPLVETFHESYPKWQELLPKLLDKNAIEIGVTGSRSSTNEANESCDGHISCDYDINNLGAKCVDIKTKKFQDVHGPKSADTSMVKQENVGKSTLNNKSTEKKVVISKKSPTKSPILKSPLNLKKYKLKLLKSPSSGHRANIKWDVQNITELTSTTEQIGVNTLVQNKEEIDRKDECKADNEQKMAEGNVGKANKNMSYTNDKPAVISSDEEYQFDNDDKKDVSLKNLKRKNKRSVSSIESTDFSSPRNKKNSSFPLKTEEEEEESSNDTMSHNNEPAKLLKIKSEEKYDMFPRNKIKKLSSNLDRKENVSPSTQVQQHEDPFFFTKDNEKYLTFGKIVEESKEEPLLKTKDFKSPTKSWDNRMSFNNVKKEGKFQRSNNKLGKFGAPNKRNTSFPENNIKLHPSWEARKKISTILPFEGKKISFDD